MNYNSEKNILLILSLLKAYNIRRVIVSPGGTNLALVASMQSDPYFEMYSCVDERSAAYMACGLAEETGEPVVISCTGATAARNYLPALTEAFYRKLPIVALTASRAFNHVGHLYAQMTDRNAQLNDIVLYSAQIQTIRTSTDEWDCNIKINKALSELSRRGGGPVHINFETSVSSTYGISDLPKAHKINRYYQGDVLPDISQKKVAIYVGSHSKWSEELTEAVDSFCMTYNAAVYCDHSSNYKGVNRVLTSLIGMQHKSSNMSLNVDLLIHIGEVSGGYDGQRFDKGEVWRVNPDGEMRDLFGKLTNVFEMSELVFFKAYGKESPSQSVFSLSLVDRYRELVDSIPELDFSNLWIAQQLAPCLPENSVLHLGILNSLRCWNCFEIPKSVNSYSNTGGFGIDGIVSTVLGASLCDENRLFFVCLGDLAFFYDLNSIGNRHFGKNLRILLINNGIGQEFKNPSSPGAALGELTDTYIAAEGHFGRKSQTLVKNIAENLNFDYMSASTKEEFSVVKEKFLTQNSSRPILFEVFTDTQNETNALKLMSEIDVDEFIELGRKIKKIIKKY